MSVAAPRVCPCRGDRDPICEPELMAAYNAGAVIRDEPALAERIRAEYASRPTARFDRRTIAYRASPSFEVRINWPARLERVA